MDTQVIRMVVSISIHTLRVEGDLPMMVIGGQIGISIHTLRVEGDCPSAATLYTACDFNPHPPRGG